MAYASLAEMRALDGLDDTTTFPDADVTAAVAQAEAEIDRYCFTTFEHKVFSSTVSGNARRHIQLVDDEGYPILYLRTLTSVAETQDGVTENIASGVYNNWRLYPEGIIIKDENTFPHDDQGRNIVIAGTAGLTSAAPTIVAWAARKLARFHLLEDVSRTDERALSMVTDFGNVMLAQASNHPERPTSLPEVNARLARYRQMSGGALQ